jgi:hypothetical protein
LATLRQWHRLAIDASGVDHTPVSVGESRVFGEQLGPGRAGKAMALVHLAMFEAVNAIDRSHRSYAQLDPAPAHSSPAAALAEAAYTMLVHLYPSQRATFEAARVAGLQMHPPGRARDDGSTIGRLAAERLVEMRAFDGSERPEPTYGIDYLAGDAPGIWRQDPVSRHPLALGAHWPAVRPFVLSSATQFRCPPPPALDSAEYAEAFAEVYRLGGDGDTTATERTTDQTQAGIFWAYDGLPSLCAPPRLYNQIAMQIATERGTGLVALARLLALVNLAMADAGIAIWESKYHYSFWRPITGIREADPNTGPSGLGDGNAATIADPSFMPLGAPASNLTGPNFTPPFPAYPSGHAGFGGALFQLLRRFYGTDAIPFTFVSDEYNGITRDNSGVVRPLLPRSFSSLSQAEEENGHSRVYLGIHWNFDKTAGITQGRVVADWVFENALRPNS